MTTWILLWVSLVHADIRSIEPAKPQEQLIRRDAVPQTILIPQSSPTPPQQQEPIQNPLLRLAGTPEFAAYMRVMTQPEFLSNLDKVVNHPNLKKLLHWELGWLAVVILFRLWKSTQDSGFLRKLWTSVWTFVVFMIGAYSIPFYMLGEPYQKVFGSFMNLAVEIYKMRSSSSST